MAGVIILLMKQSILLLLLKVCLLLGACNNTIVEPPVVLDFNKHPSVLRGSWSGVITDYPVAGQTRKLTLTNLSPNCIEILENNRCYSYTIIGNIQFSDEIPTSLRGTGYAGRGFVYALTSEIPRGFDITFDYQGQSWYLYGVYLPRAASDPAQPAFEGSLSTSGSSQSFRFRLDVHSNP
jgi:hypothetical protein